MIIISLYYMIVIYLNAYTVEINGAVTSILIEMETRRRLLYK